jgi:hypothetical protein
VNLSDLGFQSKTVIIVALSITGYGPKHQVEFLAESLRSDGIDISFIANPSIFPVNSSIFLSSFYSVISSSPPFIRVLFSSFIIPLFFWQSSLLYVDDSGSLIPHTSSYVLCHNPLTFYPVRTINNRHAHRRILSIVLHKLFVYLSSRLNPFQRYLVQSEYLSSCLSTTYSVPKTRIFTIDNYALPRTLYPHYSCINSISSPFKLQLPAILVPISPRPQKNIQLVFRLAHSFPRLHFYITSSYKSETSPANIHFLGSIQHSLLLRLMCDNQITAIFFPSLLETFGLPILESFFACKPCVAPSLSCYDSHIDNPFLHLYNEHSYQSLITVMQDLPLVLAEYT